jgi:fumarylacetoacetase
MIGVVSEAPSWIIFADWGIARDIQGLEMDPLGPLNGKSFMTSISPWVIVLDALKPFETPMIPRHTLTAPYLHQEKTPCTYDVAVQADMIVEGRSLTICKSGLKSLYWSFRDLVAHQTSNGCNLNTGDMLATGTISGDTRDSHGCLLEMTKGGRVHFTVDGAFSRTFLRDGDTILISAYAGDGVGFGECVGQLVGAHNT